MAQLNENGMLSDLIEEIAEYKDQVISDYMGNPLIEALPPIMTKDEFSKAVTYYPPFEDSERFMNPEYRLHCVMRLLKYFQPLARHIELEQKVSRVLRYGYIGRNPMLPHYKAKLRELKKIFTSEFATELEKLKHLINDADTPALGLTIIGVSGVGKTTGLKKILNLYPQVIVHSEYKKKLLNIYQIVWIKIDCPHGGSLKDLCIEFFGEVDRLIGTNYKSKYGSKNNTDYVMLAQMCQIAYNHCVGMLIIDEIQNLDQAKSGGRDQMLNFFVRLDNTIGIPVVVVGTNKAIKLLQGEFRQGRRREGVGSFYWERFKIETKSEKTLWNFFVSQLFEYQWTEEKVAFDDEFSLVLYDESQGVTDIAVKLYMLTQFRVIVSSKIKKITPSIMRQVAIDSLKLVRPMLDAVRSGNPDRIADYGDITPIDIDELYEKFKARLTVEEQRRLERSREKFKTQTNKLPDLNQIISGLLDLNIPPKLAKTFAEQVCAQRDVEDTVASLIEKAYRLVLSSPDSVFQEKPKQTKVTKSKETSRKYMTDDLRIIVKEAKLSKITAYEGLKNNGIIKSSLQEFVI
jgi:AAA domain